MFFTIPQFSYSLKKQTRNPKKVYCIDTGFASNISLSFSRNIERLLENIVFIQLKRLSLEVNYFRNKGECDFVAMKNKTIEWVIQVCYELTPDNLKREINGLVEALNETNQTDGYIFTYNQKDFFEQDGKKIHVLPVWNWLMA